jgi:subtilase family serine protease
MRALQPTRARRVASTLTCTAIAAVAAAGPAHGAGLTPAQIHRAYALPKTSPVARTIAIIVPYHTPTAAKDLATFSKRFRIAACTTANGCFRVVNQRGQATPPPADPTNGQWVTESALGVQTARGVCQNCRILLVETDTDGRADLTEAVSTAVKLGAKVVVSTFLLADPGGSRKAFSHPGVAITVASGDSGYFEGGFYPAALPGVVAVGGTRLYRDAQGRYKRETVWNEGSGQTTSSGCATFTPVPSYQRLEAKAVGCGTRRSIVDVAAVAWPGAQIYTSTPVQGEKGWGEVGGTSFSTPLIAGVFALAGGVSKGVTAPARLYGNFHARAGGLHDVTAGTNGSCKKPICAARKGYDGPTGIGTPRGLAAFRRR